MKYIKAYTLISYYFIISAIFTEYLSFELITKNNYYLLILFVSGIFLFLIIVYRLIKGIFSYSLLFKQLLILICVFFALEFQDYSRYIFILMSMMLYIIISSLHSKNQHKLELTIVYLVYGFLTYLLLLPNYSLEIDAIYLIYYAFFPYLIIILILFSLKFTIESDKIKTKAEFTANKLRLNIKRNLLLNILSIIIYLI